MTLPEHINLSIIKIQEKFTALEQYCSSMAEQTEENKQRLQVLGRLEKAWVFAKEKMVESQKAQEQHEVSLACLQFKQNALEESQAALRRKVQNLIKLFEKLYQDKQLQLQSIIRNQQLLTTSFTSLSASPKSQQTDKTPSWEEKWKKEKEQLLQQVQAHWSQQISKPLTNSDLQH